jgi:hypothetical protein
MRTWYHIVLKRVIIEERPDLSLQKKTSIRIVEEFEDTKGVNIIRISKKNRQHKAKRYQRGNHNPYIEEQTTQKIPKG